MRGSGFWIDTRSTFWPGIVCGRNNCMKKLRGKISVGIFITLLAIGVTAVAQSPSPTPVPDTKPSDVQDQIPKTSGSTNGAVDNGSRVETDSEEAAAILPYYNNYLRDYHLGPEDVISVEVFGQPIYSKAAIVIPPNAKISYPLIPGGVFVGGKTVDEVAEDIKRKLDEYIIEPKITVTLDKVGSARFSVLGVVGTPGVRVMNRRLTLFEALAEAGGIQKGGDKGRVLLVRMDPKGGMSQQVFDMDKVMKGRVEVPYLIPGDQVIVPEKKWSLTKILSAISRTSALGVLFGVPF